MDDNRQMPALLPQWWGDFFARIELLHGSLLHLPEGGSAATIGRMLDGIAEQCRDPFGLFVCGEFNVGKSSLINALSGRQLCDVGVLPTTGEITVAASAGFCWVDSPGLNSLFEAHQERTEQYAVRADALLFVTSVERPVTQSELDFLRRVARSWRKRIIVAINKVDLVSQAEGRQIVQFVAEGLNRAGIPVHGILPVSSTSGIGVAALREQLLCLFNAEGVLQVKQAAISDALKEVSRLISDSLTEQIESLDAELSEMDRSRRQLLSRFDVGRRLFSGTSPTVGLLFTEVAERFEELVDERMQIWKSMWTVARRDKAVWEGRLVGIIHELGIDGQLREEVARVAERLEIFLQAFNDGAMGADRSGHHRLSQAMPAKPLFHPGSLALRLQEASQRAAARFVTGSSCAALSGISVKLSSIVPIEIGGIFLMAGFGLFTLRVFPSQKKRFKEEILGLITGAQESFEQGLAEGVEGVFTECMSFLEAQTAPVRLAAEKRRIALQEVYQAIYVADSLTPVSLAVGG